MANDFFQFKQFRVTQARSAMKVGTDGVLLGAWCDTSAVSSVLDVGSGTGLISLMIAQRNPQTQIHAVELDEAAVYESRINIANSPFSDRIEVFHSDFQSFDGAKSYDLIISNPPFFKGEATDARSMARNDSRLLPSDLFSALERGLLSNETARIAVIIPAIRVDEYLSAAADQGLGVVRRSDVRTTPVSDVKRCLLEFSPEGVSSIHDEFIIEEFGRHQYSQRFKELVADFYL